MLAQNKTFISKILTIIAAYALCMFWSNFASAIITTLGYPYDETITFTTESDAHAFFYAIIFAPLWEELAFRYAPITIAKNLGKENLWPTIVGMSCFFGWIHYSNPESILLQGVIGLILSVLYIKNGYSYWSSVIVHALYNLTVQ